MKLPNWLGILALCVMVPSLLMAATVRDVSFESDGRTYVSCVVAPDTKEPLPGVFMVPNWMGVTDAAKEKAARIADMGYVVYVADLYSKDVRPKNSEEASAAASALRSDRTLMRKRLQAALDHFQSLEKEFPIRPGEYAAIGFCFGGGAILELARTGAPLKAFVSFHGDLTSPTLETDSKNIKGSVLVLHGADDPFVPPADVQKFEAAMRKSGVDWQLNSYGGAVHSFTDPSANRPGAAEYNPVVARRAFAEMNRLFGEVFGKKEKP